MSKKCCDNKIACAKKTSIGGQALIEGIMMRGPERTAMAVRDTDGQIVLEKWDNQKPKHTKIYKIPFIRGVFNFVASMKIGYKCLMRSAEIAGLEEEEPEKKKKKSKIQEEQIADVAVEATEEVAETEIKEEPEIKEDTENKEEPENKKSDSLLMTAIMVIATVLGVVLSVFLFIMLPSYIYKWLLAPIITFDDPALVSLIKSAFEGILKIAVLVAYMALVSLMKDIRRTFQYHGAEHKTIFCYESGLELTVENVRNQKRFHPRCGTSFLILMLLVGMFFSFFIDPLFIWLTGDVAATFVRVIIKILMLPLFMGVGYELIKLAGRHDNLFTRIISAPGMWLQRVTVREPDDDMIECAIKAFVEVIPEDQKKDEF